MSGMLGLVTSAIRKPAKPHRSACPTIGVTVSSNGEGAKMRIRATDHRIRYCSVSPSPGLGVQVIRSIAARKTVTAAWGEAAATPLG